MKTLLDITQLLANVATCAGVFGVWVAYRQFRAAAAAQKQTTAITAWSEYLRLALAHPTLARPAAYMTGQGVGTPEFSQYRWFVAAMLFAAEQVLEAHPDDRAWADIVAAQLRNHVGFLQTDYFDPAVYSLALRAIASDVVNIAIAQQSAQGLGK